MNTQAPPYADAEVPHDDVPGPANRRSPRSLDGDPPPYDAEIERALLGGLMFTGENVSDVVAIVGASDFYVPAHRRVFDALISLHGRGVTPVALVLEDELGRRGQLEDVGGRGGLMDIQGANVISGDAAYLAQRVKTYADARAVIETARALEAIARSGAEDLTAAIAPHRERLGNLGGPGGGAVHGLRAGLLSLRELAELPTPQPLIEDVLWSNTLNCLYGRPGSAKTLLALDWALSVATGTRWQGLPVNPAKALWIAAEGAEGVHQRAWAWQVEHQTHLPGSTTRSVPRSRRAWAWQVEHQTHGIGPDRFSVYPEPVNLFEPKPAAALAALAAEDGFGLVIVDTLARSSLGAEENSAKDMGQVVEAADTIRRRSGAAVLLVHHTGRNGENARGSSAIDGAVFTMWKTELESDTIRLVNEKAKEAARVGPLHLRLVERARSVVLQRATGTVDALTEGPQKLLRLLNELDDGSGVAAGVWQRSAATDGVAERSFYRWQKGLAEQAFTTNVGSDRQKRFTLTQLGQQAVQAEPA